MKVDYKNKKLISQEEIQESQLEYAIEETKLELQSSVLATRKSLEEAKNTLASLKQEYPLDIEAIAEAKATVEEYSDGLRLLQELQEEFGF